MKLLTLANAADLAREEETMRVIAYSLLAILGLVFYFLPSYVGRKKRNASAIVILNVFLGWTFLGWVVALIWATTKEPEPRSAS